MTLDSDQRAQALLRSACSSDPREDRALLQADPALARHDLATACATGEAEEVDVATALADIGLSPQP
jgi:hypothetical protein